jgi:hypothetical protein
MPGPLHWFRNPKKLGDDELMERLLQGLVQLHNERWKQGSEEYTWIEATTLTHLREVEARIAQGTLWDVA